VTRTYLDWVVQDTPTRWWHDSADLAEMDWALARGAVGITTNPVLVATAMKKNRAQWGDAVARLLEWGLDPEQQAEGLTRIAVTAASKRLHGARDGAGRSGFVCAQVNPSRAGDRTCMAPMARRLHAWADNIAVKLPATAAGLDVLEDCIAEGVTVTATVSFTVPQLVAIAERHRAGARRARAAGVTPGQCFAVLMIGRLDDYLREVAHDRGSAATEADIRQSGLAVAKRAHMLYRQRGYDAVLLVAALRGSYHLTELAGADAVMSIHPNYQRPFVTEDFPREARIDKPIEDETLGRLHELPDFVRAYEVDGLTPSEFVSFGATQRTLSQFVESGWKELENLSADT
jgi:transaldolase